MATFAGWSCRILSRLLRILHFGFRSFALVACIIIALGVHWAWWCAIWDGVDVFVGIGIAVVVELLCMGISYLIARRIHGMNWQVSCGFIMPWILGVIAQLHVICFHCVAFLSHLTSFAHNCYTYFRWFKCCCCIFKSYSTASGESGVRTADKLLKTLSADDHCEDVAELARRLLEIVRDKEETKFNEEHYERLVDEMRNPKKMGIYEFCCFPCGYLHAACVTTRRAIRRNVQLQKLKKSAKKARMNAGNNLQHSWQLVIDQHDWYVSRGYCFCDVIALLITKNDRASRVLRFLKAVDDRLALPMTICCQKPLWIPTPEQRLEELVLRQNIVSKFSEGRYYLSNSVPRY